MKNRITAPRAITLTLSPRGGAQTRISVSQTLITHKMDSTPAVPALILGVFYMHIWLVMLDYRCIFAKRLVFFVGVCSWVNCFRTLRLNHFSLGMIAVCNQISICASLPSLQLQIKFDPLSKRIHLFPRHSLSKFEPFLRKKTHTFDAQGFVIRHSHCGAGVRASTHLVFNESVEAELEACTH